MIAGGGTLLRTVTVTWAVPVAPTASLAVTEYVVVLVGVATGAGEEGLSNEVLGDH
jgi:hypothetical protein